MGTLTICRVSKALPSSRAKVEVIRTLTSADVDDADVAAIAGRRHASTASRVLARIEWPILYGRVPVARRMALPRLLQTQRVQHYEEPIDRAGDVVVVLNLSSIVFALRCEGIDKRATQPLLNMLSCFDRFEG